MKKKVLIIDTSILCVWLQVCGMETCGSGENEITYKDVSGKIEKEREDGTIFVLPLATIIETGNHITHANGDIYKTVEAFVDLIKASANSDSPLGGIYGAKQSLDSKESDHIGRQMERNGGITSVIGRCVNSGSCQVL